MLLSHNPPFIFIHIDKVAGSSIQLALQPHALKRTHNRIRRRLVWLGLFNRWSGVYRVMEFPEHVAARTIKRCLPQDLYAAAFKFAFVRNPWDRLVSRYSYLLRTTDHPRHEFVRGLNNFEAYLLWEIRRGKMHQHTYVTDARGNWLVDFVGYFERLEEDFAKVCKRLGLHAELPRTNISSHRDYRTYYDDRTRDLVAKHFQRDIELFGYTFESLPAKSRPRELVSRF